MIRALSLAFVLLTRIPAPVRFEPRPEDWGRSAFFFPLVGLAIGLSMTALATIPGTETHTGVWAIIMLVFWTLLTGGLHLDGLADTADAWIGGHGDRERTLAIMKDPRSGPAALMAIILVMLAKFTGLQVVLQQGLWELLLWTPVLGRAAVLLMMMTVPYARPDGMGAIYTEHLPRVACAALLLAIAICVAASLRWDGVTLILLLGIGFFLLRRWQLSRIGGITGDTLGATCELTETGALLLLILLKD